jgi:hypothetical protein
MHGTKICQRIPEFKIVHGHSCDKCPDHLKQSRGYTCTTKKALINCLMMDRVSQVSLMQKTVLFSTMADISDFMLGSSYYYDQTHLCLVG